MIISHSDCAGLHPTKRYRLIQNLSYSDRSQVDLVERLDTKEHYISKLHKTTETSNLPFNFLKEIETMQSLSHRNLLSLHHYSQSGQLISDSSHIYNCAFYLTDYYPQGDLLSLVFHNPEGLEESIAKTLFTQLAQGLDYMHSSGLAHGDVRLENCLVTNEGEIKLSDFEFCKPANLPCQVFEGSNYYMSPEIIRHVKYLPCKSDVFAAGCVLFSLIFGCPAFESASLEDRWYCTLVTRPEKFWNHLESRRKRVKYDLRCLLGNMLCYDPEDRMDFKEILSHPWLRTENL